MVFNSLEQRTQIINKLKANDIMAVFHYLSLHKSPFYKEKHGDRNLVESDSYTDTLLRLPLFFELNPKNVIEIIINS